MLFLMDLVDTSDRTTEGDVNKITLKEFFSHKDVFKPKHLALMAIMLAFTTILSMPGLTIYISETFQMISFAYLPAIIVARLFGPWASLTFAIAADTVSYFVFPQGPYFPGFVISEMVSCFIYALFLYKQELSIPKIIIARILVLLIVSFGLNFLWLSMLYGSTAAGFFTGARIINNLVQFPFHIALIYFVLRQVQKIRKYL